MYEAIASFCQRYGRHAAICQAADQTTLRARGPYGFVHEASLAGMEHRSRLAPLPILPLQFLLDLVEVE